MARAIDRVRPGQPAGGALTISAPSPAAVFAALRAEVVEREDFTRLDRSLLWAINAAYWQHAGHRAFGRDHVPFGATSDGTLSVATADLLACWARESAAPAVLVVELGPGSGVFARVMCQTYLALRDADPGLPPIAYLGVDGASAMARDLERSGVLAIDGVTVEFATVDLGSVPTELSARLTAERAAGTRICVVANYLLDSLPARRLRRADGVLRELEVRVGQRPGNAPADLRSVTVRGRFVPVDMTDPIVALAAPFIPGEGEELTVNSGAIGCIDALVEAIGPDGLFLIADYPVGPDEGGGDPVQRFGGSVASGLHFASIDQHCAARGWRSIAPERPAASITSRLIGEPMPAVGAAFSRIFSLAAAKHAAGRVLAARAARAAGRLDEAVVAYEAAVAAQPANWSQLIEAAAFALTALNAPAQARALAEAALAGNPIAPAAWNLLGDCAYADGDLTSAAEHFERADALAGGDARARLNLAYCAAREERLEQALGLIAGALAIDQGGLLTNEILERQREIIGRLATSPPLP